MTQSMRSIHLPFDNSRVLSGPLAWLLLSVLACGIAWFTLRAGEDILEGAKHSEIVNIDQRNRLPDSIR